MQRRYKYYLKNQPWKNSNMSNRNQSKDEDEEGWIKYTNFLIIHM